jgi:hypothetical protein
MSLFQFILEKIFLKFTILECNLYNAFVHRAPFPFYESLKFSSFLDEKTEVLNFDLKSTDKFSGAGNWFGLIDLFSIRLLFLDILNQS